MMESAKDDVIPLILAGGRGTRIAHIHPDLPKPAIPVAGRPFLAWILSQLSGAAFSKAVISSGYLAGRLRAETNPWIPEGMDILWIDEPSPLGTGGGSAYTVRSSGLRPENWLIMNGDSYLGGDWPRTIRRSPPGRMTIVGCAMEDTARYGRLVTDREGFLVSFSEKNETGPGVINAGIYSIPDAWLRDSASDQLCSMERDLIPAWLRLGHTIEMLRSNGPFIDVGTPESLALAEEFVRAHAR